MKTDQAIAIVILSPEGFAWTEGKIFPDQNGNARFTFTLSSDAPAGTWKVVATYIDAKTETGFFVSKAEAEAEPAPIPSPASIRIATDKTSYMLGDQITVRVAVKPVKSGEPVVIIVNSPKCSPWIQKIIVPDERGNALYTFSLQETQAGACPVSVGTWRIDAKYIDATTETMFSVLEVKTGTPTPIPSLTAVKISVQMLSKFYKVGETAQANVVITDGKEGDVAIARLIDPDGTEIGVRDVIASGKDVQKSIVRFYLGAYKVELKEGTWQIAVEYANVVASDTFTLIKDIPVPKVTSPQSYQWAFDKKQYKPGDTVFVKGKAKIPVSLQRLQWTAIVLDPEEDVYLEKEVKAGSDGSISFSFELTKNAKVGQWSIQVLTGESIEELSFEVGHIKLTDVQGTAVIKNLKKTTLISVKNTGEASIKSIFIRVDQGSVQFVKAKNWERKRISDDVVAITSSKLLEQNQFIIVLLKWKERPDVPRDMSASLAPMKASIDIHKPCESAICVGATGVGPSIDIDEFPIPFVVSGTPQANLAIIVGDNADALDVVGAVDIIQDLQAAAVTVAPIPVGVSKIASEIEDITMYNAIVVGGPCANPISAQLLGNPEPCWESVPENTALVKLYEHANGNVALLISGRTALDTRMGVRALVTGQLANVDSSEAIISGTSLTDIKVTAV